jgi:eukaryotic-like serine/threonine-protein kinase
MNLKAGVRLADYELVAPLGSGGMGEVWLARELRLERNVALKFLPADLAVDSDQIARFEQEARLASALNHPNVCHIYAPGETADSQRYIAMEYVEGETLRSRLAGSRLAIHEALDVASQIASALGAAHAAGIVHRDIKPENVMLRPDGLVKVLDFGLSKLVTITEAVSFRSTQSGFQTRFGTIVGTVAYMSPEQARGQRVDARTDTWSLGVVLYEMVMGRRPFEGETTSDVLAAILSSEPSSLRDVRPGAPDELQRILNKTLRKRPEQRYQSAVDFHLDLKALRETLPEFRPYLAAATAQGTRAGADRSQSPLRRAGSRTVSTRVLLVATLLCAIGIGTVLWWARRDAGSNAGGMSIGRMEPSLRRVTHDTGLQTGISFSPDGAKIAYAADRGRDFDIWVRTLATGEVTQITHSPGDDLEPDWPPDGSTIVFRSTRNGGGIFTVPAAGGPERRIANFGTLPQWSPDGSMIMLWVDPELPATIQRLLELGRFDDLPKPALYIVDRTGHPRKILEQFLASTMTSSATWHPDGRISLYVLEQARGGGALYTVGLDEIQMASVSADAEVMPVILPLLDPPAKCRWASDGGSFILENPNNGSPILWRFAVDPATLKVRSRSRLAIDGTRPENIALSRDGKRLGFTDVTETSRLWVYPFDDVAGVIHGGGKALTPVEVSPRSADLSPTGNSWQPRSSVTTATMSYG